jgi:hypothetical protein
MTPTRFGRFHIEIVKKRQITTYTIVFLGEPAVRLCKKFVPSGPETGKKLHQTYCFFAQSRAAFHRPNGEGVAVVAERNEKKIQTRHQKVPNSCPAKPSRGSDGFLIKNKSGQKVTLHASGGPILKSLKSDKKQPTPSSSSGNQLFDYVKKSSFQVV